jgi:hypothetical protein
MALVRVIERVDKERQTIHSEVSCCASIVADDEGRKYVQLDTFGSTTRAIPGKVSQSMQFNEGSARVLIELLEEAFPSLR